MILFYLDLCKKAVNEYNKVLEEYNSTKNSLVKFEDKLSKERNLSMDNIKFYKDIINSIANTPQDFAADCGKLDYSIKNYKKSDSYNIRVAVTTFAPGATIGAAIAIIKTMEKFKCIKSSRGNLVAAVALGAAVTAGLSYSNKKEAEKTFEKANEITKQKKELMLLLEEVKTLDYKICNINTKLADNKDRIACLRNANYLELSRSDKNLLGSIVNLMMTLIALVEQNIGNEK